MEKLKILVVDDEQVIRDVLRRVFELRGYVCEYAEDGKVALEKLENKNYYNLLITDVKMPRADGLEVLKKIKKSNPFIEVIILTGYPTVQSAVEALKIGAFDYIAKPFDLQEIQTTVERCLERQKASLKHIEFSELISLFEVSKTISAMTSLDSLLAKVLDSALEITGASHGSLLLLDEKSNQLKIKVARGLSDEVIQQTSIAIGEGIAGKVAQEGKPVVGNIEKDEELRKPSPVRYESKSSSEPTFVSIPLQSQNRILGVINVSDKASGESFSEREQTLLLVLAGQAAVAIENAQLYDQLRSMIVDLKNTVEKLNSTQTQLIQSEKLAALGRFSSGIAHEVKNPLAILLGGIDFLEIKIPHTDEDVKTALEKMKEATMRANNILLNLLKFARPSELKLEKIKPEDLIMDTINLFKYRAPVSGIDIRTEFLDEAMYLNVDKNQLQQVLFNVLSNATEAMPHGGSIIIKTQKSSMNNGSSSQDQAACAIEIMDTGEGISPENLSRLFEPFFSTKREKKGTGLGLSLSRSIVESHKGTMQIESEAQKGTTVTILLPAG